MCACRIQNTATVITTTQYYYIKLLETLSIIQVLCFASIIMHRKYFSELSTFKIILLRPMLVVFMFLVTHHMIIIHFIRCYTIMAIVLSYDLILPYVSITSYTCISFIFASWPVVLKAESTQKHS